MAMSRLVMRVNPRTPAMARMVQQRFVKTAFVLPGRVDPGRLGDASMRIVDDPRCDPRLANTISSWGVADHVPHVMDNPFSAYDDASNKAKQDYVLAVEEGWEGALQYDGKLKSPDNVETSTTSIKGPDGNDINLYISRPKGVSGPLPAAIRLHGGGFCILDCKLPLFQYVRDSIAVQGVVVIGVDFRNAGGKHGTHPFPAALNDVEAATNYVYENKESLGISNIIVTGDQAGGGLACATAIRFKNVGKMGRIQGVFAQFPTIYGNYDTIPPELASLVENDGYVLGTNQLSVFHSMYDYGGVQFKNKNPECWPALATMDQLKGLCHHAFTVNEMDLCRDEAIMYVRNLKKAGVKTNCRMIVGGCMGAENIGVLDFPEMFEFSIRAIAGFAKSF